MVDHGILLFVEDSQRITFPVFPLNVTAPEFELAQTVAVPASKPATDAAFTVIVATADVSCAQEEFLTIAR